MKSICKKHGLTEHSHRPDNGGKRCRKCMVEAVQKRRHKIRKKAIEYKGGKCSNCNYDKCHQALEFHHLDPLEKDFSFDGNTRSWEKVKKEIEKCILLCANCHREIHNNPL